MLATLSVCRDGYPDTRTRQIFLVKPQQPTNEERVEKILSAVLAIAPFFDTFVSNCHLRVFVSIPYSWHLNKVCIVSSPGQAED
jgi:hypothetical protein